MRAKLIAFSILLLTVTAAHAQFAIGVAFTSQHITQEPYATAGNQMSSWIYGPSFSFQGETGKIVKFGFDTRVSLLNAGGVGVNSATIGPRLGVHTPMIGKFYGEFLLGVMNVQPSAGRPHTGHMDNAWVVGLDHTVAPHIDWRVFEYAYSRVFSTGGYANEDIRSQISTGVLLRF